MWFSTSPETKSSSPLPKNDDVGAIAEISSPNSGKTTSPRSESPANSVESLPDLASQNINGKTVQPTSLKRSASASGVNSRSSSRRRPRVQFDPKEKKFPTKQFTPERAMLLRPGTSAKNSKAKKCMELSELSKDVTVDIMNDNDQLRDRIDQLLVSGYTRDAAYRFSKGSSGYVLQCTSPSTPTKRNSTLTTEPCPSEVAKFSLAFDPYKVVTIIFPTPISSSYLHSPHAKPRSSSRASSRSNSASTLPQAQAMLAISSPSGSDRAQSFVFEGIQYTWQYYSPKKSNASDEATSAVERSLCSLYLTKKVDALGTTVDLVCARFLRKSLWKKKGATGAIVVDETKVDMRIVLVTLMVVLKREARGKLAKIVGMGRWR